MNDLTRKKFGRLTVIKRLNNHISPKGKQYSKWQCKCDCGNIVDVLGRNLNNGNTQSCGCFAKELSKKAMTKHGQRNARIYNIWSAIKDRCYNENNKEYHLYGGRGITVCAEWLHDFQAFYDWAMSNGYADDLTIDRIDNDKGYSPFNCKWATRKEQNNNKRSNNLITFNGKTQTIAQWADEKKMKYSTLNSRINRGWSIERTLNNG